jgi:hypothetical protein
MTREAIDALNAWHETTRVLREATPWTAEWVRLRMIAEDQRATFEALISETEPSAEGVGSRAEPVEQGR